MADMKTFHARVHILNPKHPRSQKGRLRFSYCGQRDMRGRRIPIQESSDDRPDICLNCLYLAKQAAAACNVSKPGDKP